MSDIEDLNFSRIACPHLLIAGSAAAGPAYVFGYADTAAVRGLRLGRAAVYPCLKAFFPSVNCGVVLRLVFISVN